MVVSVTDLSLGSLICPSSGPYVPQVNLPLCARMFGLRHCPAGSLVPPLLRQNGVSRWAMGWLLKGSAEIFLP